MAGDEKDGYYCSICGGIPPDKVRTKRVLIEGKETGIDHLEFIFEHVETLHLTTDPEVADAILRGVREFNYVPMKKTAAYAEALLREYREWEKGHA